MEKMKQFVLKTLPWIITIFAIYLAFRDINWQEMFAHITQGKILWLLAAVILTVFSYVLRTIRWEHFFPNNKLAFIDAYKVLILGFFMNNILPARAGELVRAHLGSKISGKKRTLVLATIASERLVDGLMLSIFFIAFALFSHTHVSRSVTYVALLFFIAALTIMAVLFFKESVFKIVSFFCGKANSRITDYAADRFQIFINGLSPMFSLKRLPYIGGLSFLVWLTELFVYYSVSLAFNSPLSFMGCILFMVAVNFSSLIPAAPGGIGVIEAVASVILVGIGLDKELALSMVISQHLIQFIVIAVPGIIFMLSLKKYLRDFHAENKSNL